MRCVASAEGSREPTQEHKCWTCQKKLPFKAYSPIVLRWLMLDHTRGNRTAKGISCEACQYPYCSSCKTRAPFPPPHTAYHKKKYFCTQCRYPSCDTPGCNAELPHKSTYAVWARPQWICSECRANPGPPMLRCKGPCKELKPKSAYDMDDKNRVYETCKACQRPACIKCAQAYPAAEAVWNHNHGPWICPACVKAEKMPKCRKCQKKSQ